MTYHHSLLDFDDCGLVAFEVTAMKMIQGSGIGQQG